MKKLLLKFWRFLNSIFLELLLSFVGIVSWIQTETLGSKWISEIEDGFSYKFASINNKEAIIGGASVDITSGFDGGALAMGLITCICIFGIVWIQINKSKP